MNTYVQRTTSPTAVLRIQAHSCNGHLLIKMIIIQRIISKVKGVAHNP